MNTDELATQYIDADCNTEGPPATDCVVIEAGALMNGGREAVIIHNGERYRLRITSKNRLILTK